MNLNSFEKEIDGKILNRGYDYYLNGNITQVILENVHFYTFYVEGTRNYKVTTQMDDKEDVLESNCTCPYDFGPICKHQVAAYFLLRDILNDEEEELGFIEKVPEIDASSLKDILDAQPKEELIKIILDMTHADETLKNRLLVRYSKGNDASELKQVKQLIQSIENQYTDRGGFISYWDTYDFAMQMETVLEKISQTKDPLLALDMAFLLLEEAVEAFQYADDSNGDIGGLAEQTIDVIGEIIEGVDHADSELKENMFDKMLMQTDNEALDGWEDYRLDLLKICVNLADTENHREKLTEKINQHIQSNADKKYKEYAIESLLRILMDLIETYGTDEEAVAFLKEHLKYSTFREKLIEKNIEEKNDQQVIRLALEGEKQDKDLAGLVIRWKTYRYGAYRRQSMKKEQQLLAKEMLFRGDFSYYQELKGLTEENHADFYAGLKKELKESGARGARRVYLQLILGENDVDALMEFVRENPRTIDSYAEKLKDKYKDEVIRMYRTFIESQATSASNRKMYRGVCQTIKKYGKVAGKKKQNELIDTFKTQYKRKPAFVDELSKIN